MGLKTMWEIAGFTDQWQFRCPDCQRTKDLTAAGGYRLAHRNLGIGKRSLGWCSACRSLRFLIIEPSDTDAAD